MIKRKFENIILWFVGVKCTRRVCEATLRFNAQLSSACSRDLADATTSSRGILLHSATCRTQRVKVVKEDIIHFFSFVLKGLLLLCSI